MSCYYSKVNVPCLNWKSENKVKNYLFFVFLKIIYLKKKNKEKKLRDESLTGDNVWISCCQNELEIANFNWICIYFICNFLNIDWISVCFIGVPRYCYLWEISGKLISKNEVTTVVVDTDTKCF